MFDFEKVFISAGISYNEERFETVLNRTVFNNRNVPPTKPARGGLWASEYLPGRSCCSSWHRHVIEKMYLTQFAEKVQGESTLLRLNTDSRVFCIDEYEDIKLEFPNGAKQADVCLPVMCVPTGGAVSPEWRTRLYIDHEQAAKRFDALYISFRMIRETEWLLSTYEQKIREGSLSEAEDREFGKVINKIELFEDWHVDTLLVYNKQCVKVLSTFKGKE